MSNSISKIFSTLTICLCIFVAGQTQSLQGATLHALLVGDTYDEDIGQDCQQDLINMKSMLQDASKHTGMKSMVKVVKDQQATTTSILNYLNNLILDKDDVLFLYFSMHGYRTASKKNPWPNLYLGEEGIGIDFHYISQFGKDKMPRLLISIADVCNSYSPEGSIPTITGKLNKKSAAAAEPNIAENYKKLFLNAKGSIVISGSLPGEYSWSTEQGGAFTVSFLRTLRNNIKSSKNPTWNQILKIASQTVEKTSQSFDPNEVQHPQVELLLK